MSSIPTKVPIVIGMAIKSLIGIQKNIVLDYWIPSFRGRIAGMVTPIDFILRPLLRK